MNKRNILISMLGATLTAQANYNKTVIDETDENILKQLYSDSKSEKTSILNLEVSDYLAAHRSHSSHRSHRSSSSGGYSSSSSSSYTPSYKYTAPSYSSTKPKKKINKTLVSNQMKKKCKNLNGYNTWDFKRDIAACKVNGKYIKYSKLNSIKLNSNPLGQESKIKGSYPPTYKSAEVKRKSIIKQAQLVLLLEGLYFGKIDGVMGTKTREAINKFKQRKNIKSSSYLGIKTLNAMGIKGF